MDNRMIGVFDSGLGGLTVVREMMHVLPHESIIYFGDTGRVPYGTRGEDTIIKYASQDIRFLESFRVKMIIIACGTVSAVALPHVKGKTKTPLIGVVEATANAASMATKKKRIGIIGTPGTIHSYAFEKALLKIDKSIYTVSTPCPLFVPLVENGHTNSKVAELVAEEYLQEIRKNDVDTLILGCTHYPHLKEVIAKVMGDKVTLIDPGVALSNYLQTLLKTENICAADDNQAEYKYYVSDAATGFEKLGSQFLSRDMHGLVEKIDIEKY